MAPRKAEEKEKLKHEDVAENPPPPPAENGLSKNTASLSTSYRSWELRQEQQDELFEQYIKIQTEIAIGQDKLNVALAELIQTIQTTISPNAPESSRVRRNREKVAMLAMVTEAKEHLEKAKQSKDKDIIEAAQQIYADVHRDFMQFAEQLKKRRSSNPGSVSGEISDVEDM